jgi:hypothetical protein
MQSRRPNPIQDEIRRATLELASFDTPFSSPAERGTILEYIEGLSGEMRNLSLKADLPLVAHLLNLVHQETGDARKGKGSTLHI